MNRSLPQNVFCQLLGDRFGTSVLPGQIHSMLTRSFGNDASAKSLNYLGLLQQGLAVMQVCGAVACALSLFTTYVIHVVLQKVGLSCVDEGPLLRRPVAW
ncbi:MAG: hypothetical protein HC767_06895 [Akkermansiaceae bacterium]|nr:hypothetical protein [Akkermansiaceae bacterium]